MARAMTRVVVGAGATPDLIHQYQAAVAQVVGMLAVSVISTIKVDSPRDRLSERQHA